MLEFRILGPLEVLDGEREIVLSGRLQRALLAVLVLHPNQPVSVDHIVDALWGAQPPRTATTSLQNAVSQLRKVLGPGVLHTRAPGYFLELDESQVDLTRFERLRAQSLEADPERRGKLLTEALALWRGSPLADVGFEEFALEHVGRLSELRLATMEERFEVDLALDRHASIVGELEAFVRQNGLRERPRGQLMLALYRSGRQAEALAVFDEGRRRLVEELGIEPGPELRALHGSILRQERSLVAAPARPLEDHFDEIERALGAGRLVPVLGPGASAERRPLAPLLAERFGVSAAPDRGLAYIAQVVAARNGIGPLHDELRAVCAVDGRPTGLQHWLSVLPPLLRARRLPYQLIVTTAFDGTVERAFAAAGEDLDVVTYLASGRDRGRFLHIRPDGEAVVIHEPNAYADLSLDDRTVLLKIHGSVDENRTRESLVVCEDDHIDYLAGGVGPALPVQLGARLRRSHLLFLGYEVGDWSLRVFLRRVWGTDRLAYRSWSVGPAVEQLGRELWSERGVEALEADLETYAGELTRIAAGLEATL